MKRIVNQLFACALALPVLLSFGCSGSDGGGHEEDARVTLESNKTSIIANGTDRVSFRVKMGDLDISSSAEIQVTDPDGKESKLEGTVFTTNTAGAYEFSAVYDSKTSDPVAVTATAPQPEKFFRRVCVMDLTGTWCTNCPAAGQTLELLSKNRPDRMVILAVHGDDRDPMMTPVTEMLGKIFPITAYPMAVVDLREKVEAANMSNGVIDAYDASRKTYPATCGLRMESKYNETTGKLDITVGLTSNTGGDYRVAVMILEDGIVAKQIQDGYEMPNFKHNHVVRKLLSNNLLGESVGNVKADTEVTKEFSTEMDESWKIDNLRVVAYATDDNGYINNITECVAKNGSCDYDYNEEP